MLKRMLVGLALATISVAACAGRTTAGPSERVREPVAIWVANSDCTSFVEKTTEIGSGYTAGDLVDEVIAESWSQESLEIERQSVTVDQTTATATVELFHAPDSFRIFASLSSCESLVLFGGITETLTRDEVLGIDRVTFGGDALVE